MRLRNGERFPTITASQVEASEMTILKTWRADGQCFCSIAAIGARIADSNYWTFNTQDHN